VKVVDCTGYLQTIAYSQNIGHGSLHAGHPNGVGLWRNDFYDLQFLKIVIVNSTKLEGTTYGETTGSSLEICAVLCNDDKRCTGFEFEKQPSGSCRLKTGKLKRVKKPRQTAGVKTSE
jgi:PAN domain